MMLVFTCVRVSNDCAKYPLLPSSIGKVNPIGTADIGIFNYRCHNYPVKSLVVSIYPPEPCLFLFIHFFHYGSKIFFKYLL